MKFIYIMILPVTGILVFGNSCKRSNSGSVTPDNTVTVKAERVAEKLVAFPVRTSGRLSVESEQKLSFRTGGIIRNIFVKEGENVKKGQLLARLNLSEIQAQVNIAEEAFEKAERDFSRAENLYKDSVVTLEQYQDAVTRLELARSNLEIARFNLKYSRIEAPAIGKILKILMEENEITAPGYPVLLFGSTESLWVVKANVTDKDVVSIHRDDSAYLFFDAFPGTRFPGKISEIAGMADPYTGTYEIEICLADRTVKKMAPGFIAKAEIIPDNMKKLIAVPVDAVFNSSETTGYVYEILDTVAVMHKISFEHISDDYIYIRDGLSPGTYVITEGTNYIDENSVVKMDTL